MSRIRALETRERVKQIHAGRDVKAQERKKELAEIVKRLRYIESQENPSIEEVIEELIKLICTL